MIWWMFLLIEFIVIFATSQLLVRSLGLVFYRIFRSTRVVITLLAFLFFPGVVIHELSHALAAGVLFVRVHDIEFLPEIRGDAVKLGSVQVSESDFIRRFFIGVAPFLLGTIVLLLSIWYLGQGFMLSNLFSLEKIGQYALLIYVVFVISNTMFSSKKDLEGAVEFILFMVIVALTIILVNKNAISFTQTLVSQKSVLSVIQPVIYLLLIPVVINLCVIGFCKLILKK